MTPRHIAELAKRSRRIDLYANPPCLVVTVPPLVNYPGCVNQIGRVDVNGEAVAHTLIDRGTARLHELPPEGALVSIYWVHPADWCHRLMVHLHAEETEEAFNERLVRLSHRHPTAPPPVAGLAPPEGVTQPPRGEKRPHA